jgi:PAS domain S-box-containing protein
LRGNTTYLQGENTVQKMVKGFWKNVIETMREGLMIVDPDGHVIFANQTFADMMGYTSEELQGRSCELFQCDRCYSAKEDGVNKYCALFEEEEVLSVVCIFRRKDGSRLHLLKNASIIRDRQGRVIGGVETLVDLNRMQDKEMLISRLRRQLHYYEGFQGVVGDSELMRKVFDLCRSAAQSDASLIIYGESGTGKEILASAIHHLSQRRDGPFIKVNCASLNENLLESELFGHVKGAFTGADYNRVGRFEAASGGSMFLDEIGDLPLTTQTKLLRVLQEKEIERVGDHRPVKIDVRIIAATHKDLPQLIDRGLFREDLYYRIGVIPVEIPPLRERVSDIILLVEHYVQQIRERTRKPIEGISQSGMDLLLRYSWPGNIRELVNVMEYAFVLCPAGMIEPEHLPASLRRERTGYSGIHQSGSGEYMDTRKQRLVTALEKTGGNQSKAAAMLGVSRVTVWKWIKKYGIRLQARVNSDSE